MQQSTIVSKQDQLPQMELRHAEPAAQIPTKTTTLLPLPASTAQDLASPAQTPTHA